jgi:type VI secretion system protein ImpA
MNGLGVESGKGMQIAETGLLEAISSEHPCGDDLEDTQLLASFDAYRIFGQSAPLSGETDWREIRDRSLAALKTSKDFRLLTHLASATLRSDGIGSFLQLVPVAARWLEAWPDHVFPRVDDDAILRRNALNGFADRMAVVDGVRRAPLIAHRALGSLSIRDIEIVNGHATPSEGETAPVDANQLAALLAATALEELGSLVVQLENAVLGLKSIEEAMRSLGGVQAAPDFANVAIPLARTLKLISDHVATRAPSQGAASESDSAAHSSNSTGVAVNGIRSREDATRALDAVAEYFRANEPSSPIPLLIERTKRLVAKDFLAVLEELAPDALAQAKAASGVRDS